MKMDFSHTYDTCVHSRKRRNADWKVFGSCPHPDRIWAGKCYVLPHTSLCPRCRYYERDESRKDGGR